MAQSTFRKLGGAWQLLIPDAEALARISDLDSARWAVTSLPVRDLRVDQAFITYIDPDKRGRILVRQLIEARDWLFSNLSGRAKLPLKTESLALADIDQSKTEGSALHKTAERLICEQSLADKSGVLLADVRSYRATYAKALANGDGVICAESTPEADSADFIKDIIATVGSRKELSGNNGIGIPELEKFIAQGKAFLDWKAQELVDALPNPAIFVWGADTAAAAAAVKALDAKITQYFLQCDLVRQDSAAAKRLSLSEDEVKALQVTDPAAMTKYLIEAPLALPNPEGRLPLRAGVNPHYMPAVGSLAETVVNRALAGTPASILREDWVKVRALFDPYNAWIGGKPPEPFDKLDSSRLLMLISGPSEARIRHFVELDLAAAPEVAQIDNLEKLVLYQRWILELANNFVNLSALYDLELRTLFEMGTVVIDGRRLEFSMKVVDRVTHKKVAAEGRIFVAYTAISEREGGPVLFEIAAPVTRGERGRLNIGKRGVFYHLDGRILDAQIVDILEFPISILEAIKAPFIRTAAFVSKKIEDFAASKAAGAETAVLSGVQSAPAVATKPNEPKKADPAMVTAVLAGGGFAIAGISGLFAAVMSSLNQAGFYTVILWICSLVSILILFSAFLSWLKLRLRDLGPVFEASGWAINPRMRVNGRLARIFNRNPGLPPGHGKDLINISEITKMEDDKDDAEFWPILFITLFVLGTFFALWYQETTRKADKGSSTPATQTVIVTPAADPSPKPTAVVTQAADPAPKK